MVEKRRPPREHYRRPAVRSAKPPSVGPDEKAAIALALGKARKRRHPDVVTILIPPDYGCTIAFEQKEFGLARHLTVRTPPSASSKGQAEAVVAIAEAFGFVRSTVLGQWIDEDGDYHVLGSDLVIHPDEGSA